MGVKLWSAVYPQMKQNNAGKQFSTSMYNRNTFFIYLIHYFKSILMLFSKDYSKVILELFHRLWRIISWMKMRSFFHISVKTSNIYIYIYIYIYKMNIISLAWNGRYRICWISFFKFLELLFALAYPRKVQMVCFGDDILKTLFQYRENYLSVSVSVLISILLVVWYVFSV